MPFFAALGGFTDLSDRVADIGGKAAYAEGIWNTTQVEGQEGTWAIPWFTEARSIYYRKDVLEKAGVDPATAFKDLDSFKATLQAIKDKVPDIEPFGAPGKKAYDLVHQVMPFVWDNGGAELSSDAKTSTINSPEAQQGVEFMGGLITAGLFDKSQLERDGTQVENQFKGGRSPSGSAARGCSARSAAPRTTRGPTRRARTSASRRCRPGPAARRSRSWAART